ncbi:MAG: WhiB family transcriptional regulator [Actinomycetes bacterium]
MTVLFSELLVPGWAEGGTMIGMREVTAPTDNSTGFNLPCHSADPETFFAETPAMIAFAKSLCGECPVRTQCLEGALSRSEPCGVWGGELFDEGRPIIAKRAPGRPRLQRGDVELAG